MSRKSKILKKCTQATKFKRPIFDFELQSLARSHALRCVVAAASATSFRSPPPFPPLQKKLSMRRSSRAFFGENV
jgi:hypothetical protein